MTTFDHIAMQSAIDQAEIAASLGEVPVGAAIFMGEKLISASHNRRELDKSAMSHAEMLAIEKACKILGGWRLWQCVIYVTLEPCPMCAGAIINSRIPRVVFGAFDPKAGALGSIINLAALPFNHRPDITFGIRKEECSQILKDFFAGLRRL